MANVDFDVSWRVAFVVDIAEEEHQRMSVSVFEFYGEALAYWRQLDVARKFGSRPLLSWVLIDPNGFEILDQDSRLIEGEGAGRDGGWYRWDSDAEEYVSL
jgi:hypothetical protein